ncbi:MAG: hypothetical protein ACRD36_10170, partial [Candidatus Acidiferrum sp.]
MRPDAPVSVPVTTSANGPPEPAHPQSAAVLARLRQPTHDPAWVRVTLILMAVGIITVLIVIPVANVFVEAFRRGVTAYVDALWKNPETRHAILLTLV